MDSLRSRCTSLYGLNCPCYSENDTLTLLFGKLGGRFEFIIFCVDWPRDKIVYGSGIISITMLEFGRSIMHRWLNAYLHLKNNDFLNIFSISMGMQV